MGRERPREGAGVHPPLFFLRASASSVESRCRRSPAPPAPVPADEVAEAVTRWCAMLFILSFSARLNASDMIASGARC